MRLSDIRMLSVQLQHDSLMLIGTADGNRMQFEPVEILRERFSDAHATAKVSGELSVLMQRNGPACCANYFQLHVGLGLR